MFNYPTFKPVFCALFLCALFWGQAAQASAVQYVDVDALNAFYESRDGRPFWTRSGGLSSNGRSFYKAIEESWTHGLNPEHYHWTVIQDLAGRNDHDSRNTLEYMMSDAFVRLARDMSGMRVSPDGLLTDARSWQKSLTPPEALDLLRNEPNLRRVLASLEPQSRTYEILRGEMELLAESPEENAEHMLQVAANLERLRWVPKDKPSRHIVVNIPSATLWGIEGGKTVFEMPVIVGRKDRPTYSFISDITGVRLNPHWTVPTTIKREDILPKLQVDPGYLKTKGMELIQRQEEGSMTIDPAVVDWQTMTPDAFSSGYMLVQTPGVHNPLGDVRVLMYNKYDIYLHGTNRPDQFSWKNRTLSSGCVRVSEPDKVVDFILQDPARRQSAKGSKTTNLYIEDKLPVYLFYFTNWIDDQGRIVYGADPYDLDRKLIAKLKKIDGMHVPMHN